VEVVGHASHTGSESYNDKLSELRASWIRQRLVGEAPGLSGRITAKGVGFRENIVGIGTDDVRDAQDRRVSFKFRDCERSL
jgi:outer membrane protein OmpA-like peptidoglycan-associated protein